MGGAPSSPCGSHLNYGIPGFFVLLEKAGCSCLTSRGKGDKERPSISAFCPSVPPTSPKEAWTQGWPDHEARLASRWVVGGVAGSWCPFPPACRGSGLLSAHLDIRLLALLFAWFSPTWKCSVSGFVCGDQAHEGFKPDASPFQVCGNQARNRARVFPLHGPQQRQQLCWGPSEVALHLPGPS